MSEEKQLTRVVFRDDDGNVETLWAFDLGENLYRLDKTPWYQYGVYYRGRETISEEECPTTFSSVQVTEKPYL